MLPIADRIKQAGIIAVLRDDFPMPEIIEIGDALLAAPVLALEISLNSRNGLEALAELRQRAGKHMLIGAGDVRTAAQVEAALAAEAQFVALSGLDLALLAHSQARRVFALPQTSTLFQVQQAQNAGCQMVKFLADVGGGPRALDMLQMVLGNVEVVVSGDISLENVAEYAQAGASAVAVGRFLIAEPYRSMAEIISNARALQAVWEETKRGLYRLSP